MTRKQNNLYHILLPCNMLLRNKSKHAKASKQITGSSDGMNIDRSIDLKSKTCIFTILQKLKKLLPSWVESLNKLKLSFQALCKIAYIQYINNKYIF